MSVSSYAAMLVAGVSQVHIQQLRESWPHGVSQAIRVLDSIDYWEPYECEARLADIDARIERLVQRQILRAW
jgi:hypothetical protein